MQRALSKLAAARARKHWTLEQAAEYIGTNANTLYRWEKGKAMPRAYNIEKLCEVYEAAASDLGLEGNYITAEQNTSAPTETTEAADDGLNPWRKQDLTLRLMKLLWQWPRRNTRYHLLQAQIVQETEEYSSMSQEIEYLIGRREALHCLAFLPIELCGLSKLGPILNYPAEEILTQCAAGVTACWYLHRGKELALTSHIVESYLPTLKAIAKSSSSQHRKAAADLLTQCVLLKAALARHLEGTREAISYMQQAVTYSKVAENAMLHIIALRTLSIAYYYANQWKQALQAVEEATYLLEHAYATPMPKLLHSCVYAVLANRQALNGQKQDALTSLGQAHTTFHQQTTGEPIPIWVGHDQGILLGNDAMTHFHLGLQKEALGSFAQSLETQTATEVSRVETWLDQVLAEMHREDKPRDMDWCIKHWTQGIEGAKVLQSKELFNEAIRAYTAMRAAWPGEKQITQLRELVVRW